MKIGFFGGTFDPVHRGHTGLARQLIDRGCVDRVVFLPSARPPHKDRVVTPFSLRTDMLRVATRGEPRFSVSEIEKLRKKPSFTYDTLEELSKVYGNGCIVWVIGSDSLATLHEWYRAKNLVDSFEFLVYPRGGESVPDRIELARHWNPTQVEKLYRSIVWGLTAYDWSATAIRESVMRGGRPVSVEPEVMDMIETHHLYSDTEEETRRYS